MTGTSNLSERLDFLISRLPLTLNKISPFFFFSPVDNDFVYIFNSKSTFRFSDIFRFLFLAFGLIFQFLLLVLGLIIHSLLLIFQSKRRILISVISASRTGTFNSPDIPGFLHIRLPPISNEIPHLFFRLSSTKTMNCLFSYLSSIPDQLLVSQFNLQLMLLVFRLIHLWLLLSYQMKGEFGF
jgi:hypothetical protein